MKLYFAPLESLTNYVYRNIYAEFFGSADKYFTPFLSPNQNKCFSSKELNDILPENNKGLNVVPQLLTNKSEHFIWACNELSKMGYTEVNLNLGCPSPTVVTKKKGSGFLTELDALDEFLYDIFDKSNIKISIKTRLGRFSEQEFEDLIEIFNKYPICEFILHPRVQTDFYKNPANKNAFEKYYGFIKSPVCYNGDIFTKSDYDEILNRFEKIDSVMIGRGVLSNPSLLRVIKGGKRIDKQELQAFHDVLYSTYKQKLSGDVPVMHKMKELWSYMNTLFEDNENAWKKIRKAKNIIDYEFAVKDIFNSQIK